MELRAKGKEQRAKSKKNTGEIHEKKILWSGALRHAPCA
jgi:hypothetical protein